MSFKLLLGKFSKPRNIFFFVLILYIPVFIWFFHFEAKELYQGNFPVRSGSDGPIYEITGKNLYNHHILSPQSSPPYLPETMRTPGYPFFIAIVLFLFRSLVAVSFVQIVITALVAVIVYLIASSMMPRYGAIAAALFSALNLNMITLTINLLSEVLFIFLMVGVIYGLFFNRNKSKSTVILLSGLVLGGAILVRPIGLFLPIFICFFYLILHWPNRWRPVLKNISLIVIGSLIVITPWLYRNHKITGHWSLTSVGMYDVLFFNIDYFLADKFHRTRSDVRTQLENETGIIDEKRESLVSPFYNLENTDKISAVAYRYLREYKFEYSAYHLKKEIEVFGASGLSSFLNEAPRINAYLNSSGIIDNHSQNIHQLFSQKGIKVFAAINPSQYILFVDRFFWALVSILAVLSVFLDRKGAHWIHRLLFLSIMFYLPFFSAPWGDVRYRVPAHPFMFILAVWSVCYLLKKYKPLPFRRTS